MLYMYLYFMHFSAKHFKKTDRMPLMTLMTSSGKQTGNQSNYSWLLFDYGGVIAEEGFHNALTENSIEAGYPPEVLPTLAMDAVYESGYVTGTGSDADFWQLLREHFPLSQTDEWLSQQILHRFTLRPAMLELVDTLHRHGYRTAILSDQTDWLDHLDKRDRFFHHFDRVFNSYYLGIGKRDETIFDLVTEQLAVPPAETIFIDDNQANVRQAQSRGLHALLFVDIETLRSELTALLEITLEG